MKKIQLFVYIYIYIYIYIYKIESLCCICETLKIKYISIKKKHIIC